MGFYDTIVITGASSSDFSTWISVIITALIGVVTIYVMVSLSKRERKEKQKEIYNTRISLIHSLSVELNQVSSPGGSISINSRPYSHIGNLEWYRDSILPEYEKNGNKGAPPHDVWQINTSEYLSKLPNRIKGRDLVELKKLLVLINQKLELIRNYFLGGVKADKIKEVIKETIRMVEDAKEFLRKEFNIRG